MANKFPPVGKIYQAKFGELAYHLNFDADGKTMTFTSIGTAKPVAEPEVKVNYTATEVADMVFRIGRIQPCAFPIAPCNSSAAWIKSC